MRYQHNGQVAVLYSPGFGYGWSTDYPEHAKVLLFHPLLVEPVHQRDQNLITLEEMQQRVAFGLTMLGLPNSILGSMFQELAICWVSPGTRFYVKEYDGNESVTLMEEMEWHTA